MPARRGDEAQRPGSCEYEVMAMLVGCKGEPVGVDELAAAFSIATSRPVRKVRQVLLSRLRQKLRPGHAILSTHKGG